MEIDKTDNRQPTTAKFLKLSGLEPLIVTPLTRRHRATSSVFLFECLFIKYPCLT